jgi:RHS repeat-associated protein
VEWFKRNTLKRHLERRPIPASTKEWVFLHQCGEADIIGNLDFRHRLLSPSLGRWLTNDPLGFNAGDVNLYRYIGNGPLYTCDPSGLQGFGIPAPVFTRPGPTFPGGGIFPGINPPARGGAFPGIYPPFRGPLPGGGVVPGRGSFPGGTRPGPGERPLPGGTLVPGRNPSPYNPSIQPVTDPTQWPFPNSPTPGYGYYPPKFSLDPVHYGPQIGAPGSETVYIGPEPTPGQKPIEYTEPAEENRPARCPNLPLKQQGPCGKLPPGIIDCASALMSGNPCKGDYAHIKTNLDLVRALRDLGDTAMQDLIDCYYFLSANVNNTPKNAKGYNEARAKWIENLRININQPKLGNINEWFAGQAGL